MTLSRGKWNGTDRTGNGAKRKYGGGGNLLVQQLELHLGSLHKNRVSHAAIWQSNTVSKRVLHAMWLNTQGCLPQPSARMVQRNEPLEVLWFTLCIWTESLWKIWQHAFYRVSISGCKCASRPREPNKQSNIGSSLFLILRTGWTSRLQRQQFFCLCLTDVNRWNSIVNRHHCTASSFNSCADHQRKELKILQHKNWN